MINRRTRRAFAAAGFGLVVCSAGLAPAFGQERATTTVELAGLTTVSAPAYSASMLVKIPRTVHFPEDGYLDLPYIRVTGTASAAAVYLIPDGTRRRDVELPMLGRLPTSLGRHTIANFPGGDQVLAAGKYRLVVVHTSGTANVTLILPGLAGRASLRPRTRTTAQIALLRPPAIGPRQFTPVGTSGIVNRRLTETGFLNVNAGVQMSLGGLSHVEGCMYEGGSALPDEAGLLPGCSDGSAVGQFVVQGTMSYASGDFLNWGPGMYGLALDYQATALPTGVAGWAAWVPYNG